MNKVKLTNYKLNRDLFSLIENIETPVYCFIEDINSLGKLTNFHTKQKSKKKYYDLSNTNKLLSLFNKFI
tara:strand:- start:901 stop:1110 length:210 start_codon:yes stop_codon:yes gene_type:complete